jgi:hypothetical protein
VGPKAQEQEGRNKGTEKKEARIDGMTDPKKFKT